MLPQLKFPCRDGCKITKPFGAVGEAWITKVHKGTDIDDEMNAPIYAAWGGIVAHAGEAPEDRPNNKAWGLYIIINHFWRESYFKTYSCHLSSMRVAPGMEIEVGNEIAKMGNSGNVKAIAGGDGSHLCFGLFVLRDGKWGWEQPKFFNEGTETA